MTPFLETLYTESNGVDENEILFPRGVGNVADKFGQPIIKPINLVTGNYRIKRKICSFFKDVFLPEGYPKSVSTDYCKYHLWNTVQVVTSIIIGMLTARSIKQNVKLRNEHNVPSAASTITALTSITSLITLSELTSITSIISIISITWILKTGINMSHITFVSRKGKNLDAQCKKWRVLASVLYDVAMGIELAFSYFSIYSPTTLCITSALSYIAAIADTATHVALTKHQALENNIADIYAKYISQTFCIYFVSYFMGIFILSFLTNRYVIQIFMILAMIHIYANYLAVKSVVLDSLNEERLSLVIEHFILHCFIPNAKRVSNRESVFFFDNPVKKLFGFRIEMGVSLEYILKSDLIEESDLHNALDLFQHRKYFPVMDFNKKTIYVLVSNNISETDVVKAYFHCWIFALIICLMSDLSPELLIKMKNSSPTYCLMRMHQFTKKFMTKPDVQNKQIRMTVMTGVDEIVHAEYYLFNQLLQESEWKYDPELLPKKSWKCSKSYR